MLIVFVIEFCGLSNSDRTRFQLVQLHLVFAVHFVIINEGRYFGVFAVGPQISFRDSGTKLFNIGSFHSAS